MRFAPRLPPSMGGPQAPISRAWWSSRRATRAHGDLATNAAMVLAKEAGTNPSVWARRRGAAARRAMHRHRSRSPGPGFINLPLKPAACAERAAGRAARGIRLWARPPGAGRKVNVEYVSANPTGPMHVGHGRGAVFGDALANLLAFAGHDVTREYYINDAGAQVDVLARSAFLRYREALGEAIGDDSRRPLSRRLPQARRRGARRTHGRALLEQPEAEWLPMCARSPSPR